MRRRWALFGAATVWIKAQDAINLSMFVAQIVDQQGKFACCINPHGRFAAQWHLAASEPASPTVPALEELVIVDVCGGVLTIDG